MDIVNNELDTYLKTLLPPRDKVLQHMEAYGQSRDFPLIGPLVGRMLCQLALLTHAKKVFELGSGFGYSAVWFSKGMSPGSKIICTDGSRENAARADEYFQQAGIRTMVDYRVGDALTLLSQEPGPFDIILNDIDKHEYPQAFLKAVPKLRSGGLLITDNVLWSGKVISENQDAETAGIVEFNRLAYASKEVHTVIVPLRDGVAVSLKL
ncbi:MAG: O-methyltransferase [Terriglobia bacterium]